MRAQIWYDLCYGEGEFSRVAGHTGVLFYGFDDTKFLDRYETDYGANDTCTSSGVKMINVDITCKAFLEGLEREGHYEHFLNQI